MTGREFEAQQELDRDFDAEYYEYLITLYEEEIINQKQKQNDNKS